MKNEGVLVLKLSLVVPMYGVEKYLHKFLNSLERNLKPGIEVLIINDGTKDNSGEIAEKFAVRYPDYVNVVHKENGGISSARNKGIELAKGEYIIFPDPDDCLAEDYVDTILMAIDEYDMPDMIFFDYYVGCDEKGFKCNTVPNFEKGIVVKEKFMREHIKDTNIKGMVWCKAIKKSLYDGLWFNTNTRIAEDYELLTDLVLRIEKIVYIPKPLYYYIMRENSLTHTGTLKDMQRFYDLVLDRYLKHSKVYKDLSVSKVVRVALDLVVKEYREGSTSDLATYENVIKENIKSILWSSEFKFNEKRKCLFVYWGLAKSYYRLKHKNR